MAANAVLQRGKQLAFETPEKKEVKLKDEMKSDTLTPSPVPATKKPCSVLEVCEEVAWRCLSHPGSLGFEICCG